VERRAAARSLELVHAPEADGRSVRDSAASRVADALRARIMGGELLPGARLSQERVQEAMGVSRSTLREALQLLIRERLLVHELSRGVFVRRLSLDDVADLYRARRIVECAALRAVDTMTPAGLRRLRAAIDDGRQAAAAEEWGQVAAASIRFHEALVALAGSPRLDTLVSGVLAEFRLAYGLMDDTQAFHVRFLARHEDVARAVSAGDLANAADLLDDYLRDAELEVRAHYR
jgi:DNA-binding GntR family transcriptional regulator